MLKNEIGISNTCRASFYVYTTKNDIDRLVELLSVENLLEKSL
jgi:selenocysteine lyase/cysteine desulfurase